MQEANQLPERQERRRTRRVLLVVRVKLAWTREDGERATADAETEVVNAHGARLRMKPHLSLPLEFEITNTNTNETRPARLVGVDLPVPDGSAPTDGLRRISIEFPTPSETFWGITIPGLPGKGPG